MVRVLEETDILAQTNAPKTIMDLSEETNESEITQEKAAPGLCSQTRSPHTIKAEKHKRIKICYLPPIALAGNNLKERLGSQHSSIFFTDASQIYFRKLIKSLARL